MSSEDEKLLNDVSESEATGFLDIYIRFNEDLEKDYCFQIKSSTTFEDLFKIFDTLPIALRPNIFHNTKPIGFKISTSPGYLTEDGYFLFDYEAGKMSKTVKDLSSKVSDHVWPGQLLLPIWESNDFGYYAFVSLLLVWLYTDLPDFISPTPGICLTNYASKVLSRLALAFGHVKLSHALIDDINEPVSITAQIIFFVFHTLKCLIIFGVLYTGMFNPIKFFRFGSSGVKLNITKEELIELGWTGSRKATPDDYKEYYRDYKIKEFGGMVPAHQSGLFDTLKNLGCYLGYGEGFNTPLDNKQTVQELLKTEPFKLTLNYEYIAQLGLSFAAVIDGKLDAEVNEFVKQYRRYGLLHGNKIAKEVLSKRKQLGDAKL